MSNIVVLISGHGSNLQALLEAQESTKLGGNIVAVVSDNPDAYGLERATTAGIPAKVVEPGCYASREEYDSALMTIIDQFEPDLLVLAGFMRILTPYFVQHYAGRALNVHPSLLPKYKGLNTHQRVLDAQDQEHGASIHFVTAELDGGPVVLQAKVPVFAEDCAEALAQRVQEQERRIYPLVVQWFCQGRLSMHEGRALLDGQVLGEQGYASD